MECIGYLIKIKKLITLFYYRHLIMYHYYTKSNDFFIAPLSEHKPTTVDGGGGIICPELYNGSPSLSSPFRGARDSFNLLMAGHYSHALLVDWVSQSFVVTTRDDYDSHDHRRMTNWRVYHPFMLREI